MPNFETYLSNFIQKSGFENTEPIDINDLVSYNQQYDNLNLLTMKTDTLNLELNKEYIIQVSIDKLKGHLLTQFIFSDSINMEKMPIEINEATIEGIFGFSEYNFHMANDFKAEQFYCTLRIPKPGSYKITKEYFNTRDDRNDINVKITKNVIVQYALKKRRSRF